MNNTMTAWQLSATAPKNLQRVQRALPEPAYGEVVIRIRAVSLNYRDLLARGQNYGPNSPLNPIVPASDGAGEITAIGKGVKDFKAGDRVVAGFMPGWVAGSIDEVKMASALGAGTVDGVLAEYVTLPASGVIKFSAGLSFEEASTLPCAGVTAWHALTSAHVLLPGETVLILGTGGVSLFALQLARAAGARVILASSDEAKLVKARELGAHETFNYRTYPNWEEKVLELTGGLGVDVTVDVVGGESLNHSLKATRLGGTIALIGVLAGFEGNISLATALMRSIRVQGIYVGSVAHLRELSRAFEINAQRPVIDRVFAFDDAPSAYEHLASGRHFGKVVIAG